MADHTERRPPSEQDMPEPRFYQGPYHRVSCRRRRLQQRQRRLRNWHFRRR